MKARLVRGPIFVGGFDELFELFTLVGNSFLLQRGNRQTLKCG
jgi:hypothetical protein